MVEFAIFINHIYGSFISVSYQFLSFSMSSDPISLDTVLAQWREQAATSEYSQEQFKGAAFEQLCMAFLTHDPVQRGRYEPPMAYGQWAAMMNLPIEDTGIDLVAKIKNTEDDWCAIQCKFYGEGKTLQKKHIDSFLADSSKEYFKQRLLFDTTGKELSPKLKITLRGQNPELVRIGLHKLRESPIDWGLYVQQKKIIEQPKKDPLPHQVDAIHKVVTALTASGSRGSLLMACGTGKTFTSLRIAEDLVGVGGRVLYLVPSLALMSQTVREWANDTRLAFQFYAVCSDAQVGRRRKSSEDKIDMSDLDLAFPATTNAELLAQKVGPVAPDHLTVIFATYQSLPVISEAQNRYGLDDFDLAICDEAHRTAGASLQSEEDSPFVIIHDQTQVRTHRRLYMTATPKVYAESARNKANKVNAALYSMEDSTIYGKVLYEIGFGEAVEKGLLTDYKVIVLTVAEEGVAHAVGDMMAKYELTLTDAGKYIGCWRALSKVDEEEFGEDNLSMRRAIAYCQTIKSSKQLAEHFHEVTQQYRDHQTATTEAEKLIEYGIESRHVDGTFGALARADELQWLDSVQPADRACHVLSNVRCLSEGVDVPALDAILFMHPRKSQIEVVQAVGRVMRRSVGKSMGYVILPVVIPSGANATEELDNNKTFRVVWQVLNAIRSHDERFEAMLNLLEEGKSGKHLGVIALSDWQKKSTASSGDGVIGPEPSPGGGDKQMRIEFDDLPAAIRAKIVEKCGNRKYWDEWAVDVAEIAQKHIIRIEGYVNRHQEAQEVFQDFLDEIRDDLNEGITKRDAIEMLAQHMVTRPVFEALHGDSTFVDQNPISKGMQLVLDVLKPAKIESEAESLDEFYASVARRAKAANTPLARQKIITELYDKFFRNAFPKTAARLGIVYTPIEIVDFILHSVDEVLRNEFGESLSSEGVEILDPFTGTGTFITRMLQNDLIDCEALPRKYRSEIHANEIMLLAYYIAAVNIEDAYHAIVGTDTYERFSGIILTDTFEMQDSPDLIADILPENSEQRKRQKESQIRVIVGNPPWSAGQKSQNDAAQNQSYPLLNQRIESLYAKKSKSGLKRNLYDSYILAIRWASDRIGSGGVIGVITNASWLEGNAMDGMRKCLVDEFSSIYVLNLRGNQRTQGERSRQEGGKVFGAGSRAPVAIMLLVKNSERTGCAIRYHDIGDYLSREEKLNQVKAFKGIGGLENQWVEIQPDAHHDWLNQREAGFEKFMVLGDKKNLLSEVIFKNYSQGVVTGRDSWCYNSSEIALRMNIQSMIRFYESERQRLLEYDTQGRRLTALEITNFVNNDSTKISWTVNVKDDLAKNKELSIDEGRFTVANYRPFTKTHMFFSRRLNERVLQIPQIFPHQDAENLVICVTGRGSTNPFSCIMADKIPDLEIISKSQCFSRWLYSKPDEKGEQEIFDSEIETDSYGYVRESAIKDTALQPFQAKIEGKSITHDDLFYFIYGVLHVPSYRYKYASNLQKELPRIPLTNDAQQFWMLTNAGRKLAEFHVHYDEVDPWPIHFEKGGWDPDEGISYEKWFRVEKMKHPRKAKEKDLSQIVYNDFITLKDIPVEAYDYMVNGKSAIAWVMERQGVKIDKKSQIVNDANRFAIETMKDPAYPLRLLARVITVSMETIKIVDGLQEIEFSP